MKRKAWISAEKFVAIWMESETVDDVAKKTGFSKASTYSKAFRLRRRGVKLPRHTHETINVDALNALIAKAAKSK